MSADDMVAVLTTQLSTLQAMVDGLKTRLDDMDRKFETADSAGHAVDDRLKTLEDEKARTDSSFETLTSQGDDFKEELSALRTQVEELAAK